MANQPKPKTKVWLVSPSGESLTTRVRQEAHTAHLFLQELGFNVLAGCFDLSTGRQNISGEISAHTDEQVNEADLVIILCLVGDLAGVRCGMEISMAIGLGKPIIFVVEGDTVIDPFVLSCLNLANHQFLTVRYNHFPDVAEEIREGVARLLVTRTPKHPSDFVRYADDMVTGP